MGSNGEKPRNWMYESYMKDGGKERPIPKKFIEACREYAERAKLQNQPVKNVRMKTIGSDDN